MVTIYDIAEKCKCAPSTVTKALNNYYGVSKKTKDSVLAAAKEMGYLPNTMAQYLITKRSNLIGVIIYIDDNTGLNQSLFMSILNSFKITMEENGCDLLLISKNIKKTHQNFLNHCKTRQVDGVLIFGDYSSEPIKELLESNIPIVGYDYIGNHIGSVSSDNYIKMKELTNYLIGLCHKRIVFIKGEDNFVTAEREKGFLEAINNAGLGESCKIIPGKYYSQQETYKITNELLCSKQRPTAIMFPDDYAALGGITAINKNNLKIPDDISITSYDGIELSQAIYPPLTTVRQNINLIGSRLALKLLKAITEEKKDTSLDIIESEIIYGESCKKI